MSKKGPNDIVWAGIVDAITFSAASSVVASLTPIAGGALANLLHERLSIWMGKAREEKRAETPLETLERAKAELTAAMTSIAQLEEAARSAQSQAADLRKDVEALTADKTAAEALLQVDRLALTRVLSRGRVRGLLEGFVAGVLASLVASAIWYFVAPRP